jgi:hypothetical protein
MSDITVGITADSSDLEEKLAAAQETLRQFADETRAATDAMRDAGTSASGEVSAGAQKAASAWNTTYAQLRQQAQAAWSGATADAAQSAAGQVAASAEAGGREIALLAQESAARQAMAASDVRLAMKRAADEFAIEKSNDDALAREGRISSEEKVALELAALQRKTQAQVAALEAEKRTDEDSVAFNHEIDNRILESKEAALVKETEIRNRAALEEVRSGDQFLRWQEKAAAEELAAKKEALAGEVAAGNMTRSQELAALQQFETQAYQADKARLEAQLAGEAAGSERAKKIWEELYDASMRYQRQMAADARQQAQTTTNAWLTALQPIERGFDTMISGMISQHQRFGVAVKRAAAAMVTDFIEADVKALTHWVATQAAKLAAQQAGDQAAVASNAAANAARGASDSSTSLAGIGKHAASAAAAVYDDVSQIPYVGWILAPPAAAAAFAAVLAFGAMIPSAAGGMVVGEDGLIMAHAQEMVLPAHISAGLQGIIEAGIAAPGVASGGNAGAASPAVTFAPQISALDAKSVVALFNNPSIMRQLVRNMGAYLAMNPSARGEY